MNTKNVNAGAMRYLKQHRHMLTTQEYKTLKGQILAGEAIAALKGLWKITRMERTT